MNTPRSAIVLGSGRSGTSLVAGTLAASGYHMGSGLHRPRAANPKGFFESAEINGINEELLAPHLPSTPALRTGQRWLGILEPNAPGPHGPGSSNGSHSARLAASPELGERMARVVATQPFCIKDPRFSYTLPAWRPWLPDDVAHLCVFRHPLLTAESMLEECRTARYLRPVQIDTAHALGVWSAMYRTILRELRNDGDWHFLHYDQALSNEGLDRLEAFLGVRLDRSFPDRALKRPPAGDELPAEARELYRELCELAGFEPAAARTRAAGEPQRDERHDGPESRPPQVEVSVVAIVEDGQEALVPDLVRDVAAQRGVRTELVLVDARSTIVDSHGSAPGSHTSELRALFEPARQGELPAPAIVRPERFGRGQGYLAALEVATGQRIALCEPGCRPLPTWLARASAALDDSGAEFATCDYYLTDADGQFIDRSSPAAMGEAPGPFWHSGVVTTRAALATLRSAAFRPVVLELGQRLSAAGRATNVEEPGFCVMQQDYQQGWERSREDAALLALERRPWAGAPELSVSFCTYNRAGVLHESLAAFCRQLVPHGCYELVIVDDGSSDETASLLDSIDFPVPVRRARRENGGLAAARNTGLELMQGRLVLFVNDDTIASPELVGQHLLTHQRLAGSGQFAVLGSFEQPQEALDNALLRYLEGSTEVFGFSSFEPGSDRDGLSFYTCNVSVPLAEVRAAGGFDTDFRQYGCEDTDLGIRLEQRGLRVHYEPRARSQHRHFMDLDYLARRQRSVASAYVRFFAKHPAVMSRWNVGGLTLAGCEALSAKHASDLPILESAARELAKIDVGGLEGLGGEGPQMAHDVVQRLGQLIKALNQIWWAQGYASGFREHGLSGFGELALESAPEVQADPALAADSLPSALPARAARRSAPELSVIVPTHDRADCLVQLIGALTRQDLDPGRFEVIVADDGSRRPAGEALARRQTPFELEVLRQNAGGPARARNLALARARGEIVLFLNDDAVPHSDALRRHLESHARSGSRRSVLGAFPLLPSLVNNSFAALTESTNLLFAQPLMKAGCLYHGLAFCTANLSVPRRALEAVGLFDARFPFAGAEDSELGLRLERELGMRVLFDPLIVAQHDHVLDVDMFARRKRVLGWSLHRMARLHDDPSLVTGHPETDLDAAYWSACSAQVECEHDSMTKLRTELVELCRSETAARTGPSAAQEIEPYVRRIGEHEFRLGLLFAQAGVRARALLGADVSLALLSRELAQPAL